MQIKVVITGAESTGKSTLAQSISQHYNAPLVPEYSRHYLETLKRPYNQSDLIQIAKGQLAIEQIEADKEPPILICDTGLLVMKIWSEFKFGSIDDWMLQQFKLYTCDLYILPHFNIPYQEDPLRENPNQRDILYQLYLDTLIQHGLPYIIVEGTQAERTTQAQKAINTLIGSNT